MHTNTRKANLMPVVLGSAAVSLRIITKAKTATKNLIRNRVRLKTAMKILIIKTPRQKPITAWRIHWTPKTTSSGVMRFTGRSTSKTKQVNIIIINIPLKFLTPIPNNMHFNFNILFKNVELDRAGTRRWSNVHGCRSWYQVGVVRLLGWQSESRIRD